MLTLVTSNPEKRAIPGVVAIKQGSIPGQIVGDAAIAEPVFQDFTQAGDNELGYPFVLVGTLGPKFKRLTIAFSYSQANAKVYKGYLIEVQEAMGKLYPHLSLVHVPLVTCGVPMEGSLLTLTGSQEPFTPKTTEGVVMPSDYFEGMLSHVARNRPNFQISVSARSIGAVRSDMRLLPSTRYWKGRSLMVEYRTGKTTTTKRMTSDHVGKLFGVRPQAYTPDMDLLLPAGVVQSFI